jgi:hypothetical protein
MENPTFIGVSLSNVRVIVEILCVLMEFALQDGDGTDFST